MSRESTQPSRELARLLRERRQELGLSLREVQEKTAAHGCEIPYSTLAKIEQGRLEPGLRRLCGLLSVYQLPIEAAADALELEEMLHEVPETEDLEALYRDGIEAVRRGDLRRGLSCLAAIRQRTDPSDPAQKKLRQKALLSFAICAGSLDHWNLSQALCERLLKEGPEDELRVNLMVQLASTWTNLGNLDAGLAFLWRAEQLVDPDDFERRAWIEHQRAMTLSASEDFDGALAAIDRAHALYRRASDAHGALAALGVRIGIRTKMGDAARALAEAREALAEAIEGGYENQEVFLRIQVGRLLAATGDPHAGVAELNTALGKAISMGAKMNEFLAHFYLWKAHEALGDRDRARLAFESAAYYRRYVPEQCDEAIEVMRRTDTKDESP